MSADFDNLTSGPALVKLSDQEVGHTQGGVSCTISPQNRMRTVDQFGVGEVAVVHQGDQVRMSIPFCEWTAKTLGEIYNPGNDQTDPNNASSSAADYLGIGRSSGYIYTTQNAKIIPLLEADEDKRAEFWRTTPIGEFELMHNEDDDRVFDVEHACLVEESKEDGELIGRLQLHAAA